MSEVDPKETFLGSKITAVYTPYDFSRDGLRVAKATIEKFIKRASRLYEQKRIGKVAPDGLGMYIRALDGLGAVGGRRSQVRLGNGGPKAAVSCRTAETRQANRLRRLMKKPSPASPTARRVMLAGSGT